MTSFQANRAILDGSPAASTAPLIVLYERDDAIAIPLLSQLRMAGYDVRAARTPVELFDLLAKLEVALALVDLGNATASRREFWVALDARRRDRQMHVMTFRLRAPAQDFDFDGDSTARALADVEVAGPQEFSAIVEGIRQRVPLTGLTPAFAQGGGPQMNLALGAMASFMPQAGRPSAAPVLDISAWQASPFAQPAQENPFRSSSQPGFSNPGGASNPGAASPFAQPLQSNPFAPASQRDATPGGDNYPPGTPWQASDPTLWPLTPPAGALSFPGLADAGKPFFKPGGAFDPQAPGAPGQVAPGLRLPAMPNANSNPASSAPINPAQATSQPSISDVWLPPDAEKDQATSIVPEAPAARRRDEPVDWDAAGWSDSHNWQMPKPQATAPAPAPFQAPRPPANPEEEALGEVLVEGALLSPQTLEVLKGVQQMLGSVEMKLNIGELAMLFKFLSPDQFLAALLVSRGLVSPQQIATLGRMKQELGAEGQDYDLETLLAKFHILPPSELAQIHAELASRNLSAS